MPKVLSIGWELETSLQRNGMKQKELASLTKTPNATVSDHVQGGGVRIEKAADYSDALNDDIVKGQFSYKTYGFLKSMDGLVAEVLTPTELDFLQDQETEEREERRRQAKKLIIKSKLEPLTVEDREDLEDYVMQFLDEIVVELSIVFSILKILGMTITEAFNKRMTHWIKKKYMKG